MYLDPHKLDLQVSSQTRAVRRQKKSRQKRRLVQAPQAPFKAPIHSRCCIGGFRETGLALVIVLRCDWPLCDIWFKSYEHFKIKMFLGEASYRPRTGLVQASYRPRTGAFYRRLEKRRRLRRLRRLFSPWRLKVSTALVWTPVELQKKCNKKLSLSQAVSWRSVGSPF